MRVQPRRARTILALIGAGVCMALASAAPAQAAEPNWYVYWHQKANYSYHWGEGKFLLSAYRDWNYAGYRTNRKLAVSGSLKDLATDGYRVLFQVIVRGLGRNGSDVYELWPDADVLNHFGYKGYRTSVSVTLMDRYASLWNGAAAHYRFCTYYAPGGWTVRCDGWHHLTW